jgi:signal transduction histidine kinase
MLQGYAGGAPPQQVEMLFLLRDRAGAMLGMLNDCLSLGAIRNAGANSQAVPVQLLDALSSAAPAGRIRATLKGIELSLDMPADLPPVAAVEEHIVQLLCNLMDNAIKYTDRGGRVTVSLREDAGYVVGSVEDTGIGISPEEMSRVFEEFFRAENAKRVEPYGSGLGLPLVKRVVTQCGGCLEVQSELGVGTKCTFTLPASAAAGSTRARLESVPPAE